MKANVYQLLEDEVWLTRRCVGLRSTQDRIAPMQTSSITLAATLTVQALVTMCLLTLPVVAPSVAASLGVSAAYVGVYIALAYAGAIASSLLSGAAVRRFGAIRGSQFGLVFCALGIA